MTAVYPELVPPALDGGQASDGAVGKGQGSPLCHGDAQLGAQLVPEETSYRIRAAVAARTSEAATVTARICWVADALPENSKSSVAVTVHGGDSSV
jgi:hypothetical protein